MHTTNAISAPKASPKAGAFFPAHIRPVKQPMSLPRVAIAAGRNVLETIPAVAYRLPIVSGKTVVRWHMVMEPEALKRVMLDNVENYPKSKISQRLLRPAVGTSIFTAEGEDWRWQRRAAAPIFNHRKMTALSPMMTGAASRAADRLDAVVARGFEGVGVACVMEEMVTATFEVMVDALLSGGRWGQDGALDRHEVGEEIARYINTIGRVSFLDILNAPTWMPRPAELMNRGVMNRTTAMVDAMIAHRRAAYEAGERRDDLIDYMLDARDAETGRVMDDATLRNNLFTFIIAGHETTALALTWALYLMAHAPEIQERAAAEARAAIGDRPATAEHLPKLPYLRQILDETLRLFPPAAMLGRQARADDILAGREIGAGDTVILPIYALHRHEMYWERPLAFDPDHFTPERVQARDRYLYLPFGAGPRVCIGMNFSLMEAMVILATLVARFEVAPKVGHEPTPVLTMTLRPKGGMPLKLRRR
ncbi:MAG: cytochrome P450 [Rhodobacteraceae bacterium]|nr:cytochrome P450 [Paracoccaceae bacterium]